MNADNPPHKFSDLKEAMKAMREGEESLQEPRFGHRLYNM